MSFAPSKYQQQIFDWIVNGKGHAMVEAVAGSGKTTTAVQSMKLIPPTQSILFLAFNKSIAEELKTKAPTHANVMTLNSLGHRAWGRRVARPNLNADKTRDIIQGALTEDELRGYGAGVRKLVSVCKAHGIVPQGVKGAVGLLPDETETYQNLIDHFDIEAPVGGDGELIELTRRVLKLGCEQPHTIDFDDQLYMTVVFGARPPSYDWVFVDEAQDLSPIQHRLVESALARGGRIVAIGDSRQAIYGFRGADADSMANFGKRLNATRLDLSICYRCPQSHIAMAQEIVPSIEAAPAAPEGEVMELGEKWDAQLFRNDDLIICRNSAPLVKAAYRILSQKVAVRILGRDLGTGLVTLIRKLKARSSQDLAVRANTWADKEMTKLQAKDPEADVSRVTDKLETILTFIEMFPGHGVEGICREIEALYSNNTSGILTLATVHKSKGLEAHRVFILNDFLMPSRGAKKPWEQLQESNLIYVAYTRAKSTLGFIDIDTKKRG